MTYDLDHQARLRFYQGQSLYEILCPNVKRFGHESADELTDGNTERRKQGTDSVTSTADAGGKNMSVELHNQFISCISILDFMTEGQPKHCDLYQQAILTIVNLVQFA